MTEANSGSCGLKAKKLGEDFYKKPCSWLKVTFTIIVLSIALASFGVIAIHANEYFWPPTSYLDAERLGQLGDFIGGTMNPVFGFLTVCLLLWSVFIQRKELSLTRNELKKSANTLEHQFQLATDEYNRKQIESTIESIKAEFYRNINTNFAQIVIQYEDPTDQQFQPNTIKNLYEVMQVIIHKKGDIRHPENLYHALRNDKNAYRIIDSTKKSIELLMALFSELRKVTDIEAIHLYWKDIAKILIHQAISGMILTEEEGARLYESVDPKK